jgi:uncharacterized OsmC-like protein
MTKNNDRQKKDQEFISNTEIDWVKDLQFTAKYDLPKAKELLMDEPPVFGGSGEGPNAARVLSSAIGDCLSASIIFCLNKSKVPVKDLKTNVKARVARNDENLLRVKDINVEIKVELEDASQSERTERCQDIFEKYCIVTDSIRKGIPISVNVNVK